jgi:hypothetical protein
MATRTTKSVKISKKPYPKSKRANRKVRKVMEEWKEGKLRSGSKKGPKVTSQKQAISIALSEADKAGKKKKRKTRKM